MNAFSNPLFKTVNGQAELVEILESRNSLYINYNFSFNLDEQTTIFDVCHEDGKFKVTSVNHPKQGQYVRSTYKQCKDQALITGEFSNTQYICLGKSYIRNEEGKIVPHYLEGSLEEVQISLSHRLNIIRYTQSDITEDKSYINMMENYSSKNKEVPPFSKRWIVEFGDNFFLFKIVSYKIPECQQ